MKPLLLANQSQTIQYGGLIISANIVTTIEDGTWWEVSAHPYCTNKITNLPEEQLYKN